MNKSQFFKDFKENLEGQYEECRGYRLLCENQDFNPFKDLNCEDDIKKVPFVATTLFKKSNLLFSDLLRVKTDDLEKWTISSSTTGDPSIVGRIADDIAQMRKFVELQNEVFHPNGGYDCVFYPEPDIMRTHGSEIIL